ncbi:MAG: universal stress protein [Nitrospirae bacterium]|nr:universal stress protein [Nitrospirota bacterium]
MDIKRILFPTDFSEGSSVALDYAIDMAKHYNGKLYLLHVIYDVVKAAGWYVPHISVDEMYKDLEKGAQKEIERYGLEELRSFKDIERHVIKGIPHEAIVKFAEENKIDLIVMGTHGRKGMGRILFGSTAAQVVRFAPCPVLAVRIPTYKE